MLIFIRFRCCRSQATQTALENAYNQLAETSSSLGAQNNSLSSQVSTYQTAVVNVSSSRSNIQDSDYSQTSTQQQQAGGSAPNISD